MSEILDAVKELINKAQGYTTKHTGTGGPAEAVNHELATAPKKSEDEDETNAANSGTHPKAAGGSHDGGSRPEGGDSFKDGGPEQDTIETPKGTGGRAPVARPATIKHEGGGTGPNHPGTATGTQQQQKSEGEPDLVKGENPFEKKDDDKGKDEKKESKEDEKDEHEKDDDAEKSSDSGEVYLDIDEFTKEIVAKAVEALDLKYGEFVEQSIQKSNESEYVEAGLAKSLVATLDRVEELEKAIVNIANTMNIRRSLLKSADNIKGIDNPSLSKTTLTKGEISSRLLDMQMSGNQGVDTNMVLRFDAVGDTSLLPENIRTKLGLE
jgi:hypothetical protein